MKNSKVLFALMLLTTFFVRSGDAPAKFHNLCIAAKVALITQTFRVVGDNIKSHNDGERNKTDSFSRQAGKAQLAAMIRNFSTSSKRNKAQQSSPQTKTWKNRMNLFFKTR